MQDIFRGVVFTSLIFAISLYAPLVGFFIALLIPLPILFYRLKLGRPSGAATAVLAAAVMILLLGRFGFDLLFFLVLVSLGFILGDLLERDLPLEQTVLLTAGGVILCGLGGVFVFSIVSHTGVKSLISGYVAHNLEMTLALYESMGVSQDTIDMISASLDQIHYVLVRLLPSLSVAGTLLVIWMQLLISRPLVLSRSLFYPDYAPYKLWRAPDQLVWGAIGCGMLLLFPDRSIKVIGLSGILVLVTVYFFQGIAIVSFFFHKKGMPKALRVFLYSIIALQQLVLLAVIGLGFFDIWLNFRKINLKKS
jgi:uncharacterized protein YybS (DUF2232 family)